MSLVMRGSGRATSAGFTVRGFRATPPTFLRTTRPSRITIGPELQCYLAAVEVHALNERSCDVGLLGVGERIPEWCELLDVCGQVCLGERRCFECGQFLLHSREPSIAL